MLSPTQLKHLTSFCRTDACQVLQRSRTQHSTESGPSSRSLDDCFARHLRALQKFSQKFSPPPPVQGRAPLLDFQATSECGLAANLLSIRIESVMRGKLTRKLTSWPASQQRARAADRGAHRVGAVIRGGGGPVRRAARCGWWRWLALSHLVTPSVQRPPAGRPADSLALYLPAGRGPASLRI